MQRTFPEKHRSVLGTLRREARPINLSSQNKDLMAEGENLGVFAITPYQKQPDTGDQKREEVRKD